MKVMTRKEWASTGPGNICEAAKVPFETAHEPFFLQSYPHKLGRLTQEPWSSLRKQASVGLVKDDPYTESEFRPGGLGVWDAAIGIPVSVIRPRQLKELGRITAIRSSNAYWNDKLIPALNRVGPLGPDGEHVRPKGPFIVDLMYREDGWKILEAAHVLAHLRQPDEYNRAKVFQQCLAEIVVAEATGFPLDITGTSTGFEQYGIRVSASTNYRAPVLAVPWNSKEAPTPDKTVAYIQVGMFIEPVPRGAITETEQWLECNKWTCVPTSIVIAGWEAVDVITHYPLAVGSLRNREAIKCYAMHPGDLMGADTLIDLVNMAMTARGKPLLEPNRYLNLADWLASPQFAKALSRTPPWPCLNCLSFNRRTDGAPKSPVGKWKEEEDETPQEKLEREEWEAARDRIMIIATKAVVYHESRTLGRAKALRIRTERTVMHRRALKRTATMRSLKRRIDKCYQDGLISQASELRSKLKELELETRRELEC